jgi:hypothetical protein
MYFMSAFEFAKVAELLEVSCRDVGKKGLGMSKAKRGINKKIIDFVRRN